MSVVSRSDAVRSALSRRAPRAGERPAPGLDDEGRLAVRRIVSLAVLALGLSLLLGAFAGIVTFVAGLALFAAYAAAHPHGA